MKPASLKPNRLDRVDRLELIMADQQALGMNDDERPAARTPRRDSISERAAVIPSLTRESRTQQKRS